MIKNEPILSYLKGSPEYSSLMKELEVLSAKPRKIASVISNQPVCGSDANESSLFCPHNSSLLLAKVSSISDKKVIEDAIEKSLKAKKKWIKFGLSERIKIFSRVAELLSTKYHFTINAATMLGQSKNIYQAEIDAVCETIDFLRFNNLYAKQLEKTELISTGESINDLEIRPLDGFTYAVTPFNFTAIAANLACSMALMGNVVIWKPSPSQLLSASIFMDILIEAGLPADVIQMVVGDAELVTNTVLNHPDFSGLHFTGSSKVFSKLWSEIGNNLEKYKSFPRIVGETGGKDFLVVHESANLDIAKTALIRSAFEYQGQKCSAGSRAYISKSIWNKLKEGLISSVEALKMGDVKDCDNYVNAVINKTSYDKITGYIERAKNSQDCQILAGGQYDDKDGFFVRPTVILTTNPKYESMVEEIFGPVLTIFVFEDEQFEETLQLVDSSTAYALTGSIVAQDRKVIVKAKKKLLFSAGNFYINDKCTGAVVGQQPFGGGRKSGTNDKAGSLLNLTRWISPRAVKENINPPQTHLYPYMEN